MLPRKYIWLLCLGIGLFCTGATGAAGHGDFPKVIAGIALILATARLVGELFERLGQPAVLGELVGGILIGNLGLFGFHGFDFILTDDKIALLAELGVILLLFEVGLESDLVEMARVGISAFLVAIVGVVTPVALGYGVHALLEPDKTWHAHLFVGAILAATSVGITARVLQDLGKIGSATGRVILGAAVIDDVLGLIVLAVVQGIVLGANTGAALDAADILLIIAKSTLFLGAAVLLGRPFSRSLFRAATYMRSRGILLALSLAFCFALAGGAGAVGLAPIVGAFAAGIVLEQVAYRDLESRETHGLIVQLHPIGKFLIPIFFVVTGAKVQLSALGDLSILLLAAALTVVAIVGKQVCSLVAFGPGIHRVAVGIGMIPRGEVGLIFAAVGAGLTLGGEPVVGPSTYAAIVVMVMITTMITPPVLARALKNDANDAAPDQAAPAKDEP